jgi:hypothetical protein
VNDLLESLPAGRTNRKILDSWLRARGNKILPKRSAFENALPPNLAVNSAIVEVQAPDKLIYTRRSAGKKIRKLLDGRFQALCGDE